MKRWYICLIFMLSTMLYGQSKSLSSLKKLRFTVDEKVKMNNKKREKKYNIIFEIPNRVRKEIIFPEINRGEIYIYNNSKKITYLPIFDEYKVTEIDGEENQIIQAVNKIIELEKTDKKFKKKYLKKEKQTLFLDKNTKVVLKDYKEVGNYILPQKIKIEDSLNNIEVDVSLNKIKVNDDEIAEETFVLENKETK